MADRFLIVSDLHLCEVEDHDDGWRYYKASRFVFDEALDAAVTDFLAAAAPGDACTLVLNGDIIDFDLVCAVPDAPPWHISLRERQAGLKATEAKSAWKLTYALGHHPTFVKMLARVVAAGHRVVYVIGNHDPELHFVAVREAFVDAVRAAAAELQLPFDAERIRIEPWFFYVPGLLYAEHGQQYDYYSAFRTVLDPIVHVENPARIALPMGNLSNRRLMSQMGYFNPHATDYILNVYAYVAHWLRFYAFTRRGLVFNWLFGSLAVLSRLLSTRRLLLRYPPDRARLLAEQADRAGLPVETVRALDGLGRTPITNRLYRMVREFWIDRAIMAAIMVSGTIALALVPIPLWVKLMVPLSCFPLIYFIYETFAHGETIFSEQSSALHSARKIANLLPVRLVVFGHTHQPRLVPLSTRATFVDTGTWAPVTEPGSRHALAPGLRNVLTIVSEGDSVCLALTSAVPRPQASTSAETGLSAGSAPSLAAPG